MTKLRGLITLAIGAIGLLIVGLAAGAPFMMP